MSSPARGGAAGDGSAAVPCENFSFFLTSLAAMQRLSGSANGFGGDLRYGEADGLAGDGLPAHHDDLGDLLHLFRHNETIPL